MDKELECAVRSCVECQQHQTLAAKAPSITGYGPNVGGPGSTLTNKRELIIVDSHSKWIEALVVNSTTSNATIKKLQSVLAIHGLPDVVYVFEFSVFTCSNGILYLTSAPYHPASNGLAERSDS